MRWEDKALEVPVQEIFLGDIPWPLVSCLTRRLSQLIKCQLTPPQTLTAPFGLSSWLMTAQETWLVKQAEQVCHLTHLVPHPALPFSKLVSPEDFTCIKLFSLL